MKRSLSRFLLRLTQLLSVLVAPLLFSQTAHAAPCTSNCLKPGDYTVFTIYNLLPRKYLIHVPASYTGDQAVPLLLDFHGFSKDATNERGASGQLAESDKRGFIAVWPEGVGLAWNAYGCCFLSDALHVDDVAFLKSVIATMKTRANIDADRVFVTGISNGGGMAQKMACEAADVVRAAVSVSFPVNSQNCHPAKPITVFEIAGTADTTISYAGNPSALPPLPNDTLGFPLGVQGAQDSLAEWRAINACAANVTRTPLPGDSYADVYPLCAGGVSVGLVTITNGRHILYNGYVDQLGGYDGNNAPIDVHSYIWDNIFTM